MISYRVCIFASINVEAENEQEAIEQAKSAVMNNELKIREYDFEAEDRSLDSPLDILAAEWHAAWRALSTPNTISDNDQP